jgi:uncharacterized protein with HEPN domain
MNEDLIYLEDILERINRIEFYTKEGKKTFDQSLLIQDGVIRCFEVMGEAVKHLSQDLRQQYSDILWRQIAGFRDVLIHDYMGVDFDEVWDVIVTDIPRFKPNIIKIIQDLKNIS